jgi:DNA-binding MarR family transcriptional regulator
MAMETERATKKIGFLYWSNRMLFSREISPHAIGPSQAGFLVRLDEERATRQDELVSMLGVDRAIGTRVVRKLIEAGYVRRMRDPADHRAYLLFLTPEGARMKTIVLDVFGFINESLFQGFTDEERHMALGFLDRMIENAKPRPPIPGAEKSE